MMSGEQIQLTVLMETHQTSYLGPGGLTLPCHQRKYCWEFTCLPPAPHVSAEQVFNTLPLRCLPGTYLKSTVNAHIFLPCPLHGALAARTAFTATTLTSSTMLAHLRPAVWTPSSASAYQQCPASESFPMSQLLLGFNSLIWKMVRMNKVFISIVDKSQWLCFLWSDVFKIPCGFLMT